MTTATAPALTSAAVRAIRSARPACRACGRRGVDTVTLCTGAVIVSCPWCGDERVARTAAAAAAVPSSALAVGMLDVAVEGFLF